MMSVIDALNLKNSDNYNRLDSGSGKIGQRTIELGNSVIAVNSIGTMRVIEGSKNHGLTILGVMILFVGLMSWGASHMLAFLFFIVGGVVLYLGINQKVELCLSIGTCDGRSTAIVSKNRDFLIGLKSFIQNKIDTGSLSVANINISNSTLEGNIAIGEGASAVLQS
ncbi:DUF6232 family protein [Chromobacterium piscinae]